MKSIQRNRLEGKEEKKKEEKRSYFPRDYKKKDKKNKFIKTDLLSELIRKVGKKKKRKP